MTPLDWCRERGACRAGLDWLASIDCPTLADLWRRPDLLPPWRVWLATQAGVLPPADARRFAVYCARSVAHLLTDPRSLRAIEVAERYADGRATDDELAAARDAASDAAESAASAARAAWAATSAAWDAASAAAWAASAAARDAAWAAAAWGADWEAAWGAAWEAARDAATAAQAEYLIARHPHLFAESPCSSQP